MGYAEFGARDGFPVVNAHGGLACRLDVASAAPVAAACGIRLISPDRPGVGLSDPKPGRTVLDWAQDVAELLDQLDVDRFAVMGWSMGGQYAAAVGHALRDRVTRWRSSRALYRSPTPACIRELPVHGPLPHPHVAAGAVAGPAVFPDDAVRGACLADPLRPPCRTHARARRRRGDPRQRLRGVRQDVAGSNSPVARCRRGVSGVGAAVGICPGRSHRARRRVGRHRRRARQCELAVADWRNEFRVPP